MKDKRHLTERRFHMERKNIDLSGLNAGCSALSWTTRDGAHLWGRNYDFDRLAEGSSITFLPQETEYFTLLGNEGGAEPENACRSRYACAGTGLLLSPTPVLYEGINEKGLMGGQLYYRTFAHYEKERREHTAPLQPPFLVYHLLAQCATVEEAVRCLEQDVSLVSVPMMGTVPSLHWSFCDAAGESIVIEPDRDGLHIYRNTLGVMTNSPGYPWHRLNLLNYAGIRDLDYDGIQLENLSMEQCFSGSGAQGLPGDWSSPSRFIRLAFLKQYALKGAHEAEGVSRMFRLFQAAAFPLGMVKVTHQSHITELDTQVVPYDYTVYTAIYCAESLCVYWTTYENPRIQFLELGKLLDRREPLTVPMGRTPDFFNATPRL